MIIQQISVFVENQPGKLAEVLGVFHKHGINIRALSVADTADFGILRLIVNEPEKVEELLRGANFTVKMTPVLTMAMVDSPGGLLDQVQKISDAGINIEYVYAFAANTVDSARVVLKLDDPVRAQQLLSGPDNCLPEPDGSDEPNFYW